MKIVLDACFDLAQGGYNTDNESCTNFAAAYRSAAMYFEKMTGADITIVDGSYNHDMADQTHTDIGDDEDTFETIVWQAIHNCLTVDQNDVWSWEKDAADKQISRIDWSAVE